MVNAVLTPPYQIDRLAALQGVRPRPTAPLPAKDKLKLFGLYSRGLCRTVGNGQPTAATIFGGCGSIREVQAIQRLVAR
jgi:hypothetical protein